MSITLTTSRNETRQLEPQKNLVESRPVKDSKKLSIGTEPFDSFQGITWEDLRGLTWFKIEDEYDFI